VFSNGTGETCRFEERKEPKRLRQPSNLFKVEDDRSFRGINAKVLTVHVRLGEDQRLIRDADVWDVFGPPPSHYLNSLGERKGQREQRGSEADGLY